MIIEITQYIHIIEQTANNCDILFKINTNITNNYLYFIIYSRSNKRAKFNFKYRVRSNLPKEKKKKKKVEKHWSQHNGAPQKDVRTGPGAARSVSNRDD